MVVIAPLVAPAGLVGLAVSVDQQVPHPTLTPSKLNPHKYIDLHPCLIYERLWAWFTAVDTDRSGAISAIELGMSSPV